MYKKIRSLLVAACLLPTALMPSASLAAGSLEPANSNNPAVPIFLAQNTYPPELVKVYMDVCVSSATTANVSRELATTYCRCSIDRIQSTYTLEKFLELVQNAPSGSLPPELESIASACITSLPN